MSIDYLQGGGNKNIFQNWADFDGDLLYMRAIQGHSGGNRVDPSRQSKMDIPYNWIDYICHEGSSDDCNPIIKSDCRR